ncbi:ATPase [Bacillus sp. SRB_336]|nr:ATPase [Bacillus sp. SRB_336]
MPDVPQPAVLGLDIGGSKTRGMLWAGGTVAADAGAGSANVQNVSVETARENLAELFGKLGNPRPDVVLAGAGGVDTDDDAGALRALIGPFVPGAAITVVHDTRLLLAAGGASTGVAVIAGTGSAAWGTNAQGAEARAGGWGYLLGDEGSGYWLGREAVRHTLHQMDLGAEPDGLARGLLEYCKLKSPPELIGHFHSGTTRRYWAAASPVVVAAAANGHSGALAMVDRAGADLAAMAHQVAAQLGVAGPIVLGSGLGSNVPALQESFKRHLAARGLDDVRILDKDPIYGVPLLVAQKAAPGRK